MTITDRQYQILILIATGKRTLAELAAVPDFAALTKRTLQRDLAVLVDDDRLERRGEARAATYALIPGALADLVIPGRVLGAHLAREERPPIRYDFDRLDMLADLDLFTPAEQRELEQLDRAYRERVADTQDRLRRRERERIMIELSWKSSQFEGNTYTLFETEILLKDGVAAKGKSSEETRMVLNHKGALDFTDEHRELFNGTLEPRTVIELHRRLAEGLFDGGIRERLVGITSTTYTPLENRFQFEEQLARLCVVSRAGLGEVAGVDRDGRRRSRRVRADRERSAADGGAPG